MQDGYYLSTYLTPPGLPRVVNTWLRHDNNLSLWEKSGPAVRLRAYWELERFTGVKYDGTGLLNGDDTRAVIDRLLEYEGLRFGDLAGVWGTPGIAAGGNSGHTHDHGDLAHHAVSHLFSSILLDSDLFRDGQILGLAADGGPDPVLERTIKAKWYAGCAVRAGDLEMFPIESPGTLWLQSGRRFGLREGSLMALATATDAAVEIDAGPILDRFTFYDQWVRRSAPAALDMLTERVEEAMKAPGASRYTGPDARFSERENFISVVMKQVQSLSIRIMERNIERILERFGLEPAATHLAIAGGYALNCPTNSHLMAKYGFRGFMAPPCVGDSGQSLGIALEEFYREIGAQQLSFCFPGPYLGIEDQSLDRHLAAHDSFIGQVSPLDPDQIVDDLVAAPVVWVNGRAEIGPRALGNRSLLSDPRTMRSKDELNRIKGRQWWRPVAPVVMREHVHEWFEGARHSPYMLETFKIREDRQPLIPGVAHLDESARIQTVGHSDNPLLHGVLAAFHARTGVPLLCNTSLNDVGEPIVNTIDQAMNFCLRKRLPVGYFSGQRVVFTNFDSYSWARPLPRDIDGLFGLDGNDRIESFRAALDPYGLPDRYLHLYLWNPVLRAAFDTTDERDVRKLRRAIEIMFATYPGTEDRLDLYLDRIARDYASLARYRLMDQAKAG